MFTTSEYEIPTLTFFQNFYFHWVIGNGDVEKKNEKTYLNELEFMYR